MLIGSISTGAKCGRRNYKSGREEAVAVSLDSEIPLRGEDILWSWTEVAFPLAESIFILNFFLFFLGLVPCVK
jgi:hypothetical protein